MPVLGIKADAPAPFTKRIYSLSDLEKIRDGLNDTHTFIQYEDVDKPFDVTLNLSRTCGYVIQGTAKIVNDELRFEICWQNTKARPANFIQPDNPDFDKDDQNVFRALYKVDSLLLLPVTLGKVHEDHVTVESFCYLAAIPRYYNVKEETSNTSSST